MIKNNIKIIDMTPIIKTDVFVNDDYQTAILTNIGCYLKYKHSDILRKRAKELLNSKKSLDSKELNKVYKP